MKRLCALLALLLASAFLFASCAPEASSFEDAYTVEDALGRRVPVPRENLRVAALLGSFADVFALAGGSVVAAPRDAWEDFSLPLDGAVDLGGAHSPNTEALFSASPTLVLASASTASHIAMEETLTAVGISVLYFDVDSFDDYLFMLRACTKITGRADLYEENGLVLKAQIDALRDASKESLPESERKVLLLRAASGFVKAKGSEGTVLGEMLHDLGFINIADSNEGLLEDLNVEQVIREEPYHIFVVTMGEDEEKALLSLTRMMEENPAWGTLSAVKEGRLHVMDKALFHLKPNARFGEAYETLFDILAEKRK